MNTLCISTSQLECGVLFSINDHQDWKTFDSKRTGELIREVVHQLTHSHRIDRVVVDIGPGSYTGTRIGVAFAQGFARGLNLRWIGISAWDILNALKPKDANAVIAVKSNEVFVQLSDQKVCFRPLSEIQQPFGFPLMNPTQYGGTPTQSGSYPTIYEWLYTMLILTDRGFGSQSLPQYYDQFSEYHS